MVSKKATSEELYNIVVDALRTIAHTKRKLLISLIGVKQLKAKFKVSKLVSKK